MVQRRSTASFRASTYVNIRQFASQTYPFSDTNKLQVGRTLHIHVQVHTNWTVTKNGTIDHSRVVETGQIYFDEQLTEELMAVEPYASHTQIDRVVNDEDGVFAQQVQCKTNSKF